jgi:hypothetical protein
MPHAAATARLSVMQLFNITPATQFEITLLLFKLFNITPATQFEITLLLFKLFNITPATQGCLVPPQHSKTCSAQSSCQTTC